MGHKRKRRAQEAPVSAPPPKKSKKPTAESPKITPRPFAETPKGDDLKLEVQLYDLLSSEDAQERESAALAVIEGLFGGEGLKAEELKQQR